MDFDYFNLVLFGLLILSQAITVLFFKYRLSIVEKFRTSILKAIDNIAIDKAIEKADYDLTNYLINEVLNELTTEEKIVHSTNVLNELHNKINIEDKDE